ncbi:hypothetical protein [Azospirillum sp.]|uniref:hypothetical protein n=1 Tax=Azospirillum sp. TaxID=34012 RepID=UPI00261DAFD0|nr:hypothetical protein [Azospirillum sp.]
MKKPNPLSLSFMRDAPAGKRGKTERNFWTVASSGDYAADVETGFRYAQEALAAMREHRMPVMLNWIVRDMIAAGQFGGIEVGFLEVIGQAATHSLAHRPQPAQPPN